MPDHNSTTIRAALLGYGYWGANLLRNLFQHGGFEVVGACDANAASRQKAAKVYPALRLFASPDELLAKQKPEVVLIATPPHTHATLAIQCLEGGADVLIEKPMALSSEECERIIATAARLKRRVMVDHTFVYNPAVRYLSSEVEQGTFGRLLYYDSVRVNLGGFQRGANVLWDLAPHDLSILDLLLGGRIPTTAQAMAADHYDAGNANLCYCHLTYDDGFVAHLNLNWTAPTKIRTVMLGGTRKLCIYDENVSAERVKIFDKGLDVAPRAGKVDPEISYRTGDIVSPALSGREALGYLLDALHDYIRHDKLPATSSGAGARVVKVLEALTLSLTRGGAPVTIATMNETTHKQKIAA